MTSQSLFCRYQEAFAPSNYTNDTCYLFRFNFMAFELAIYLIGFCGCNHLVTISLM